MAGGYALAWVKRTSKLQLSPGTLLSMLKALGSVGATLKVKVLLLLSAHEVLPALVFSVVAVRGPMLVWLTNGVVELSAPVTVRLRSEQRAPVGSSLGGVLTENLLGTVPVSVMTTLPVTPVHEDVRMEPETMSWQGVVAVVASAAVNELVESQVTPPLGRLVWVSVPTAKVLPLFWV
jgi:hypothetical protein